MDESAKMDHACGVVAREWGRDNLAPVRETFVGAEFSFSQEQNDPDVAEVWSRGISIK